MIFQRKITAFFIFVKGVIQLIFQAVVSNKAHPEYGQATIPFPIPDSDYDHTIELLEGLSIGSPSDRDCRVDFLDSKYPMADASMWFDPTFST